MKCPNCNTEIQIIGKDLEKERFSMGIKYEGQFLRAETVGGTITNTQKLLQEVAKSTGCKVLVAFEGVEQKDHELVINFLILPKSEAVK
jgi:hypothetical protein